MKIKTLLLILTVGLLAACQSPGVVKYKPTPKSHKVTLTTQITSNNTPYTLGLYCMNDYIETKGANLKDVKISVGSIQDLTGKFSNIDGGYKVTQGAALMGISAIGKLERANLVERTDLAVYQFETDLTSSSLLNDGKNHKVNNQVVNYRPLYSGQVVGSDYFVTGGITELNHNITSGGGELEVNLIGGGKRIYVLNVAADLRLVHSRTLEVVKTVTLQKQIVGYEWKAGLFKFFDDDLVDVNSGQKISEPIQLGVRAIMEVGVAELLASLYGVDSEYCMKNAEKVFHSNKRDLALTDPASAAEYIYISRNLTKEPEPAIIQDTTTNTTIIHNHYYYGSKKTKLRKSDYKGCVGQSGCKKSWTVQLGAFEEYSRFAEERDCFYRDHPDLFKTRKIYNYRGDGLHEVVTSSFDTKEDALAFCGEVKRRNLDCFIRNIHLPN